jgi:tripartite-type tricarboxylate transporter receptor subunit TctC
VGTPKDIVAKMNAEVRRIMVLPETQTRIEARGVEYLGSTPEELGAFMKNESTRWTKVLVDAGIKPE